MLREHKNTRFGSAITSHCQPQETIMGLPTIAVTSHCSPKTRSKKQEKQARGIRLEIAQNILRYITSSWHTNRYLNLHF